MKHPSLLSAVEDVLRQGCTLLGSLGADVYAQRESGSFGASIGAHYRHVLDHFLCLLESIRSGQVDYDQRRRSPELEGSVDAALLATEELMQEFRSLPSDALYQECIVTYSVGYGEAEAQATSSNVAREIMFCVGHAIHHYAILRLLCAGMSVPLPYEFGVAPSTLKHLEAQSAH